MQHTKTMSYLISSMMIKVCDWWWNMKFLWNYIASCILYVYICSMDVFVVHMVILNSLCYSVINQVATIITNNFTNWIRVLSLAVRLRNNHTPYIICTFPMWHFFAGFKYGFKLLHDGFIWKIPMYYIRNTLILKMVFEMEIRGLDIGW